MKKKNDLLIGCLCATGCEFFYGLSYGFTKDATDVASPFALLGWRFLLAAAAMSLLVLIGAVKVNWKGKPRLPLLRVALCSPCIYFICETLGIRLTTASETGVFFACFPVVSLTASALLLKKLPTRRQLAGICITLAGVLATVLAVGVTSSLSVPGYALLLAALVSFSLYSVSVEKAPMYTGAELTYGMLLAGAALFVPLALADGAVHGTAEELLFLPLRSRPFLSAVLFQGLGCSIGAFFLCNVALAKIGVIRTASFIGVSTVVSILDGALLLGERFTVPQAIGAAVILAGVYVANSGKRLE